MSHLVKEIPPEQIKHYVKTMRNCRITNVCELIGKQGAVTFDFSSFPVVNRCVVTFRRRSGNGQIVMKSGEETVVETVASKRQQHVNITVKSPTIEIYRPNTSIGTVDIIKVQIYSEQKTFDSRDWKEVLNRCISYSGLRVVNNELFTTENAKIKAVGIKGLSTKPPNAFKLNGGNVKFPISCQIMTLDVIGNGEKARLPREIKRLQEVAAQIEPSELEHEIEPPVYDSIINSKAIRLVKESEYLDDNIVLDRFGEIQIQIEGLIPGLEYVLYLDIVKVLGNGKLSAYFDEKKAVTIKGLAGKLTKVSIYCSKGEENKPFTLTIKRGQSATGKVTIGRISLEFGTKADDFYINNLNYVPHSPVRLGNSVESISKRFATVPREKYIANVTFGIRGIVRPVTHSANMWMSKIAPFFPGVTISSNILEDATLSDDEPDLLISCLGRLKPCRRIWLEEFQGTSFTESDWNILNAAEKVISSSLPNVQYLSGEIGLAKVEYVPRVWTYIKPTPVSVPKNYILYFNRNQEFTAEFLRRHVNPPVVVVGARGHFPDVTSFNEYLEHSKLLYLIQNAKCIVDLPDCNHYMSAALDMALMMGVPIVSTNHWISICKPYEKHIKSRVINGKLNPMFDLIKPGISESMKTGKVKKPFNMNSYNLNVYAALGCAMGKL